MKREVRQFEMVPAKSVVTTYPLWIGIEGPSSSGKTLSMLKIGSGIRQVFEGKFAVIDTEAGRTLHYRDQFDFDYIAMAPPFNALDYLDLIRGAAAQGATVIAVDSMTHEHSGEGGLLSYHEAELDRMASDDWQKRERVKGLAWTRPKANRKALLNALLQMKMNFILCFRGNDQTRPVEETKNGEKKTKFQDMGVMPEGGRIFVYESTVNILLPAGAKGVPQWESEKPGERLIIKKPNYLAHIFKDGEPLSEKHGIAMAEWARGGSNAQPTLKPSSPSTSIVERAVAFKDALKKASSKVSLLKTWNGEKGVDLRNKLDEVNAQQVLDDLTLTFESRQTELQELEVAK